MRHSIHIKWSPYLTVFLLGALSLPLMGAGQCGPQPPPSTLLRVYNLHADILGSVGLITSTPGTVTDENGVFERSTYTPFGDIEHRVGYRAEGLPEYSYTGHEYDPESSLYYMKARYYDPKSGRFLSPDPALNTNEGNGSFRRIATEPPGLNAYSYVHNRPTLLVDPDGREADEAWPTPMPGVFIFKGEFLSGNRPHDLAPYLDRLNDALAVLSRTYADDATLRTDRRVGIVVHRQHRRYGFAEAHDFWISVDSSALHDFKRRDLPSMLGGALYAYGQGVPHEMHVSARHLGEYDSTQYRRLHTELVGLKWERRHAETNGITAGHQEFIDDRIAKAQRRYDHLDDVLMRRLAHDRRHEGGSEEGP